MRGGEGIDQLELGRGICGRADFIQLMVYFGAGRNNDSFPELRAHRNGHEETNEEQDSENSYSNHACLLWNGLRGELCFTPHLSARRPYSANFQDEDSPIIGIGTQRLLLFRFGVAGPSFGARFFLPVL